MRFVSFHTGKNTKFGILKEKGVFDLSTRFRDVTDLISAIKTNSLADLAISCGTEEVDFYLREVEFLPPIPNAEKIICIGVNYSNRNDEYKDGSNLPQYPSVFMRARESLVGHKQNIFLPEESKQLDYEGEIGLVIGKTGDHIKSAEAHEYIAGTTIINEGSVRDWMRHAKFNVTQGKNFTASGSMGPCLVTPDELNPMADHEITTRINNEIRQNDTTRNIIFDFRYLVSYLSTFYILKPGDVISTGTPTGSGARLDPPVFLKEGDLIEVEVSGIGTLENQVARQSGQEKIKKIVTLR